MAERKKKKKGGAAASAVAAVTAAGMLVGGAYASPDELMNDGPSPIVQTLADSGAQLDSGSGPNDLEEELAGAEDEEKRGGVRAAVRRRMRLAPAGVRALVGVPLWCIGTAAIMALSGLWASALQPAAALALSWLGVALMAVLIFTLAVKTAFPDLPLKKILNKRSLLGVGVLCLIFGVADAALPFFWEDYLALSRLVKIVGSLVCTGVPIAYFLRRRQRKQREEIVAEPVELPEPEPTMEEKEAAARKLIEELADSVSRK